MAVIQIEYKKLQDVFEKSIGEYNEKAKADSSLRMLPEEVGVVIMHCLTENEDNYSDEIWENSKRLWDDKKLPKATVPIGNINIKIQDVVLEILKVLIEKGVVALLCPNNPNNFNPKDLMKIVYKLIASINKLNDCDRCLAYKVVNNPDTIVHAVDKQHIIGWFPGMDGHPNDCDMANIDMHRSCRFFNFEGNLCTIKEKDINDALSSLEEKGIADSINNGTEYKFRW